MLFGSLEPESFRKKFLDVRLLGAVCTLKEHGCVWPELVNHLATRATWGTGDSMIIGHRDRSDFDFWPQFGYRSEDRCALRAIGHTVGRVLHIATGENSAVCEQDRGPDPEFGIRSMCIFHHSHCGPVQLLPHNRRRISFAHREKDSRLFSIASCNV